MKRIKYLSIILLSFFSLPYIVKADAVDFYASATSITVGNCMSVTVKNNDAMGLYSITSDNSYVLAGGGNGDFKAPSGISETYQFCGNQTGSATVWFTPSNMTIYSSEQYYTNRKSVTVYVNPKRVIKLSSDNTLESLGIKDANLDKEFNKDTLEYTAMLEAGTDKITIEASPSHGGATISGAGEHEVIEGDNDFEIVVTAEDGSTRTYKIKVTVKEYNPVTVKVKNKEYIVVRNKKNLTPPDNYEESTLKIGEEEVPVYIGKITKYTLIALKDSKGNQNWYVKDKDNYILYNEYKFGSTILYIQELKDIPANFKKTTITYQKKDIVAYKENEKSDYALLYGMNVETGKTNIYMYDSKEGTVQIYNKAYFNKVTRENNLYLKITLAISVCLLISIGIIIYLLIKKKK